MWPRDATGGAYFSDHRARFDLVAGLHVDFGKVAVQGVHAEPVVDQYGVAGKIELFGEHYAATLAGVDRSTGGRGHVHAAVLRTRLAVQNAPSAGVFTCGGALDGNAEFSPP